MQEIQDRVLYDLNKGTKLDIPITDDVEYSIGNDKTTTHMDTQDNLKDYALENFLSFRDAVMDPDTPWKDIFQAYHSQTLFKGNVPDAEFNEVSERIDSLLAASERERLIAGYYTDRELVEREPQKGQVVAIATPDPSPVGIHGSWPALETIYGNARVSGEAPALSEVSGEAVLTPEAKTSLTPGNNVRIENDATQEKPQAGRQHAEVTRSAVLRSAVLNIFSSLNEVGISTTQIDENTAMEMLLSMDPDRPPLGPGESLQGLSRGNEIFITEKGYDFNTAAHEYAHIWANNLKAKEPSRWEEMKAQLKMTAEWRTISESRAYSYFKGDEDRIAGEVIATRTGNMAGRFAEQRVEDVLHGEQGSDVATATRALIGTIRRDASAITTAAKYGSRQHSEVDVLSAQILGDYIDGKDLGFDKSETKGMSVRLPDGTLYTPSPADLSKVRLTDELKAIAKEKSIAEDSMKQVAANFNLVHAGEELAFGEKEAGRAEAAEIIAKDTHDRLCKEMIAKGYLYGEQQNDDKAKGALKSPMLMPYESLTDDQKKGYREDAQRTLEALEGRYRLIPRQNEQAAKQEKEQKQAPREEQSRKDKKEGTGLSKAAGTTLNTVGSAAEAIGHGDVAGATGMVAGFSAGALVAGVAKIIKNKQKRDAEKAAHLEDVKLGLFLPKVNEQGQKIDFGKRPAVVDLGNGVYASLGKLPDGTVNLFNADTGASLFKSNLQGVSNISEGHILIKNAEGYNWIDLQEAAGKMRSGQPLERGDFKDKERMYEYAKNFHEGMALFKKEGKCGFLDVKGTDDGKRYDDAQDFTRTVGSDSLPYARVWSKGEQYVIDKGGNRQDPQKLGITLDTNRAQSQGIGDGTIDKPKKKKQEEAKSKAPSMHR